MSVGGICGPVFPVAHKRTSYMRHLYPYLMMPPGVKMDRHKRCDRGSIPEYFFNPVMKPGSFRAGRIFCTNTGGIGAGVLYHIIFQCAFGRFGDAGDDGAVILSEAGGSELTV